MWAPALTVLLAHCHNAKCEDACMADSKGLRASVMLAVAAIMCALASTQVAAQVYEYQWTDTNSVVQAAKPDRQWFAVKSGTNVVVTTIAGLDRKVKLEVKKGAEAVFSQTSATITVSNRITASDGGEFYGVKFNVPMATEDAFTVTSTVTDPSGAGAVTNNYQFRVDQTAPVMGDTIAWRRAGWAGGSIEVFGGIAGQQIDVGGVEDTISGIKSVRWFTVDAGGTRRTHTTNPVQYMADTKLAYIPVGAAGSAEVAPANRADYTVGFEAEDYAGNKAEVSRVSGIDRFTPPVRMQIKNAQTGVWEDYSAGMTIYANPIDFRAGVPAAEYAPLTGSKFGVMSFAGAYQDGDWVWLQATFPVPQPYLYWEFYTTAGSIPYVAIQRMTFSYAGGAGAAPAYAGSNLLINGVWHGDRIYTNKSVSVDAIKFRMQPRPYRQRVDVAGGWASCFIDAGSDSCTTLGPKPLEVTPGMIAYNAFAIHAQKDDGSLRVHAGYVFYQRDGYTPVVRSKEIAGDGMVITDIHEKTVNAWNSGMWQLLTLDHIATNLATGVSVALPQASLTKPTYDVWRKVTSTKSLPDGNYQISVSAKDLYGNELNDVISATYRIDNTPPEISLSTVYGAIGGNVSSIADIRISVTDTVDSSPIIQRATLSGGPLSESLEVGVAKVGGVWHLQPPRMFPTLESGHEYVLTISAVDQAKNTSTKEQVFSLTPENLVAKGILDVVAVNQQLYAANDKPLHVVKLESVKNKNGTLARGLHTASVTIRRDAAFGVVVNGLPIAPGETKELVINLVNGNALVEMWPLTPGVSGDANYMIYLPQLLIE